MSYYCFIPRPPAGRRKGAQPLAAAPPVIRTEPPVIRTEPPVIRPGSPVIRTQRPFFSGLFFFFRKQNGLKFEILAQKNEI